MPIVNALMGFVEGILRQSLKHQSDWRFARSRKTDLLGSVVIMQDWKPYAQITMALFVLLDPIGAVPIFVTLTANHTPEERKRTIDLASATAFCRLTNCPLNG